MYALTFDDLLSIDDLPEELRTGHWFNDLQHGMLVILLRRAMSALDQNRPHVAERLIDCLTMYLYVHFLDEEEGMASSLALGLHHDHAIRNHLHAHEWFLTSWDDAVLFPFKTGASRQVVIDGITSYYNAILNHIADQDQETYGLHSDMENTHRVAEISRIATAALPLSPYMPGAFHVVALTSPKTADALDKNALPSLAMEAFQITPNGFQSHANGMLLPGRRCVRDAMLRYANRKSTPHIVVCSPSTIHPLRGSHSAAA